MTLLMLANMGDETGYLTLARQVFDDVTPRVRHDLLRIPYTRNSRSFALPYGSTSQSIARNA
jgi:hypothetical protein